MKKSKRYTPGLTDIEMTMEVLQKQHKKAKRDAWLKEHKIQKKGGKADESHGKS